MDIRLKKRNSHSFINDVELPIQAMHQTSLEVGYAERLYIDRDTLYFRIASDSVGWAHRRRKRIPMHQRRAIAYGSLIWITSIRLRSVIALRPSPRLFTGNGR